MFNFLFKSKPSQEQINAEWRAAHTQRVVNQRYIKSHLLKEYARVRHDKVMDMPLCKFKVGDTVRVVCTSENFRYGWVCLGHPFKIGQDEIGVVEKVSIDSSLLEELSIDDYRQHSFERQWELKHKRSLAIDDVGTPEFVSAFNEFAKSINLEYQYHITFENNDIGIKWPVQEKFLDWPVGVQVA